jgi:hypothetical protein
VYNKQAMTKRLAVTLLVGLACGSCARAGTEAATSPQACAINQAVENPLHDPNRIADIQVLSKPGRRGNPLAETKQGIAIVLRPERGLTREWFTHVLDCDAGHQHETDSSCPLALPTARIAVDSVEGSLVVYVRYTDPASLARAKELASQFRAARTG